MSQPVYHYPSYEDYSYYPKAQGFPKAFTQHIMTRLELS